MTTRCVRSDSGACARGCWVFEMFAAVAASIALVAMVIPALGAGRAGGLGARQAASIFAMNVTAMGFGDYSVDIVIAGTGTGTVADIPKGFSCSAGTCTFTYMFGAFEDAHLTATAGPGSHFVGWTTGDCAGSTSTSCTFQTGPFNPPVTAVFDLNPACCDTSSGACTISSGDPPTCPIGSVLLPGATSCAPTNPCPQPAVCCNTVTGECFLGGANPPTCPLSAAHLVGPTSCTPTNPCPQPAVCCNPMSGECFLGGAFPFPTCPISATHLQTATSCTPNNPCPQPQPAVCCDTVTGECFLGGANPPSCPLAAAHLVGPTACTPTNPCPQPAVCCDRTTGECFLGGAFPFPTCPIAALHLVGPTSCTPTNPCPQPAVCCDAMSGACSLGSADPQTCPIGSPQLVGATSCTPINPCLKACCGTLSGECLVAPACASGFVPAPNGAASCSPQPCPQPTACCNVITGACSVAAPSAACPALTIAATPPTASCTPYPCIQALMSPAAVGALCADCTCVNGPFDGRDGQLSHLGGASPYGSKAADDFFLCESFVYDLRTFSATLFTTTFPGLVKPKGEIWSDCNGCPADKLYTFDNPLVIETGADIGPAFDGRALRIVNVTFDVTRESYAPNRNVVLHGGRYWLSIYGTSDNLGPTMQMFDVTYWGTTAGPIKGKPAYKIDGISGLPYNQFAFPTGCSPTAWHSVVDDCCIGCTDLNFSFCANACKVLVDNGDGRIQQGAAANGSTSQFAPASWSAVETRSADDFLVPPCQQYRICYVEACVLTNCPTFDGVFELYNNNCNKPDYSLVTRAPIGNAQYVATKIIPLGPAFQSVIDGKTVQGFRLEFHDLNIVLNGGSQYWISVGVRYTFSVNERAYFCYNSYCDGRCPIHFNDGRVLTSSTLDAEAAAHGCVSPAPAPNGCNGWAHTFNDFSFLIAADGLSTPGPINSNPTTPACRADYNGDGTMNAQDIFDFLNGWFSGCP